MIAASVVLCLLVAGAFGFDDNENRIVGGSLAKAGQFPWVVSLQSRGSVGGHFCGASVIGKRHILTASHCVFGQTAGMIQIQYGVVNNKERKNVLNVCRITMHEDYVQGQNYPNDIAIIETCTDMNLDGVNARAVELPETEPANPNSLMGELCGWGYRTSEEAKVQQFLLYTMLPMYSHDLCGKYLGPKYDSQLHVCAGTLDGTHKQCSGDSGGPLTVAGVQMGVVSWSFKPCTITNRPGLFSNVAVYREWIRENSGI